MWALLVSFESWILEKVHGWLIQNCPYYVQMGEPKFDELFGIKRLITEKYTVTMMPDMTGTAVMVLKPEKEDALQQVVHVKLFLNRDDACVEYTNLCNTLVFMSHLQTA
jgi:hypothetical protein